MLFFLVMLGVVVVFLLFVLLRLVGVKSCVMLFMWVVFLFLVMLGMLMLFGAAGATLCAAHALIACTLVLV